MTDPADKQPALSIAKPALTSITASLAVIGFVGVMICFTSHVSTKTVLICCDSVHRLILSSTHFDRGALGC